MVPSRGRSQGVCNVIYQNAYQGGSGIEKKYAMPIFFLRPVWLD